MGDLVGQAVEGTLYYLPYKEFQRVRAMNASGEQRATLFSDMCRLNALYMIARAGSGHIGSSFSSLDVVSWLLLEEMTGNDVYFSSKGHDAPGYYAALIGAGTLDFELTHKLRQIDGLPGHPDIGTPGMVTNTGSLGMGVSKAKGMAIANRLKNRPGRIFVMTGDGELQEGQFWESLVSAANLGLQEITVIIDHNKLQSDTFVKNVSDLGDLEAKLRAFGWCVARCDGNDVAAFAATLKSIHNDPRPKVIVADTVKGKGVSFMEHTSLDSDVAMYRFHSGAPDASNYRAAAQEIMDRLQGNSTSAGITELEFETLERPASAAPPERAQRLVAAYSRALIVQAEKHPNLVALDADLVLDTGLIPFREQFPDRFVECGIAEQDMVSTAGGMALNGLLPIVHSFACFLSTRPNEQIYNNATEKTKIIYVGSLAGVVPGGPGHSHQSVRDISALAAMPGMTLVEPSCDAEVGLLLDWCVNEALGSSYIRLISLPWEIPYSLPADYRPTKGRGLTLAEGEDVAIIAYGPVLLSNAIAASKVLAERHGISVKVINLPWLNHVDAEWLQSTVSACKAVVCLDNHYVIGGQGDTIARTLAGAGTGIPVKHIGLTEVPPSGTNVQVLGAVGLDASAIAETVASVFR
ncbi:transketolase family protein [Rhizobium laguerreae]|uniref:transketolase family protein n=1 Tax=Rhizobium laguerreae TaxID=1076926 RepID=UPI0014413C60|nr:transketolase C-terminal domain-containing protein [Rhizobium laguerreae]MBY3253055.1 transketolase [Rhizobium laguerreae]MBY3280186.1 transketolase [Rhizobium laguerreae]MBY3569263.1 transketolase [Rhizobium laguerreae]NKM19984.1 transketolase [Rhizobium laguerreae]NKM42816.1 transketolase [Rhizobium laguerreae]